MRSKIAEAAKMEFQPVAIIWTDNKPENALQFTEHKWGCVMSMFAQAAAGKTVAFDINTYGCIAGRWALGFGRRLEEFYGGIECYFRFLSYGNEKSEEGMVKAEQLKPYIRNESYENFVNGERYIKNPETVEKWTKSFPDIETENKYVIFKPLQEVTENEEPKVVVFTVDANQLSALTILANYGRDTNDNVYAPFGAGCQSIGILTYAETGREKPRAIIGLVDISARNYTSAVLGTNLLTFSVPFKMFKEMEDNVNESFLYRHSWLKLMEKAGY